MISQSVFLKYLLPFKTVIRQFHLQKKEEKHQQPHAGFCHGQRAFTEGRQEPARWERGTEGDRWDPASTGAFRTHQPPAEPCSEDTAGWGHAGSIRAWRLQGCPTTGTAGGSALLFHPGSLKKRTQGHTDETFTVYSSQAKPLRIFVADKQFEGFAYGALQTKICLIFTLFFSY